MEIKVAVFAEKKKKGKGLRCRAYTTWYNSNWSGCNVVMVDAENGNDAKKKAIHFIRTLWINFPDLVKVTS